MIQLTEKIVVRVALTYLKRHYRFLPRTSETQISSNVEADGGIVADGYLAFRREDEDDKVFTATIEATDYMKRQELRYSIYWQLLIIDSVTSSLVLLALAAGWAHASGVISVYPAGPAVSILLLLVALSVLTTILIFLFRPLRRYHYIYAVEQFKRYHADEQWIAFAWDVFPSSSDKYYQELRSQCIAYGFGLMEVDREKHVKLHLAPTKTDVFDNRRTRRRFRLQADLGKAVRQQVQRLPAPGKNWIKWPAPSADLLRFRRSYKHQMLICGVSVLLLGLFFYLELQERPVTYLTEVQTRQMEEQAARGARRGEDRESTVFIVDSAFLPPPMPDVRSYLDMAEQRRRSADRLLPPTSIEGAIYLYDAGIFREVPCQRLTATGEDRYIIYLDSYRELAFAKNEVLRLRSAGIPVHIAWADCFFTGLHFYILYYEELFTQFEEAQLQRNQLIRALEQKQVNTTVSIGRIRK